ncbi:hypothetical protein KR044_001089 [Drosophila immigrans]|nr:hypothetical protein KR044_001089 [Drosophila immigrans]
MENSNIRDFGKPKDDTIDKIDSTIATQIDTSPSNSNSKSSSPLSNANGTDKQNAETPPAKNNQYQPDEGKLEPMAVDVDDGAAVKNAAGSSNGAEQQPELPPKPKGCDKCGKKFGLTGGFSCRCGGTYCAFHRYSDRHDCSFDYRELGASEIRRDNPLVVPEKLRKL